MSSGTALIEAAAVGVLIWVGMALLPSQTVVAPKESSSNLETRLESVESDHYQLRERVDGLTETLKAISKKCVKQK